jgi:hypothetical protein
VLAELVRERDERLAEHPPTKAPAAEVVTPEAVERILRRVLPQSLHRPALEECLRCQREHQRLLHSTPPPLEAAAYPHHAAASATHTTSASAYDPSVSPRHPLFALMSQPQLHRTVSDNITYGKMVTWFVTSLPTDNRPQPY